MAIQPTHPMPLIRTNEDYEAIKAIPTFDLPETFKEWGDARAAESLQLVKTHISVREIEVKPAEFVEFCRFPRRRADFDAIKAFAIKKFDRDEEAKAKAARADTQKRRDDDGP
jgi:hypothetical protein